MKTLKTYILEASILNDIDDTLTSGDVKATHVIIQKYLEDNYRGNWTISKKPNKDGLYEVSSNTNIKVKNRKITSLTNDLFIWTSIKEDFKCNACDSLKSLDGAPKEVKGTFYCIGCNSLKSLEGAPEKIGDTFYCASCNSLESLKGVPKKIGGHFVCDNCNSLKSLEGAPGKIGGHFVCDDCNSLESLEGAPKIVIGNFSCKNCGKLFSIDDVKKVSKVNGKIYCQYEDII